MLFVISTCLFLPQTSATKPLPRRFFPYDISKNEVWSRDIPPHWYAYLGLRDTYGVKGIQGDIWIYENNIESHSRDDFVAFALTLVRPTIDGWYESFEVGYFHDNSGYMFYSASYINWHFSEIDYLYPHALPESWAHSLKLLEVDGKFNAYIDGELVDYIYFSDDVTEERIYGSQAESSDPSNPMRGHFWNLMYYSSSWHSWMNIEAYQDKPYYARLSSTDQYHSTLMGDISLDYLVDIVDATLVSAHYYDPPWAIGPLGYSAKADFDHDGLIDIFDASQVNAYWGESW